MQAATKVSNRDISIRKTIGREHLYANRIEDALAVFAGILRDYPEDVESLVILGDLYLASGDSSTAVQLYSRAMQHRKEDVQIEQRLQLAQGEKVAAKEAAESSPDHPEAVARLLQRLTGQSNVVSEYEVNRAAELLKNILKSDNPSEEVAEHLDEIDNLIPAFIEMNIRQTRSDGRYDLADQLLKLQANYQFTAQQSASEAAFPQVSPSNGKDGIESSQSGFNGPVLILVPSPEQPSARMLLLKEGLVSLGCQVAFSDEYMEVGQSQPHLVIASNPHPHAKIMSGLATCAAARLPIIVDLDTDFEQMPLDHPNYNMYGLGTPAITRAYMSALLLANLITVPSQVMAASLKASNYPVMVIPDGWSAQNLHWKEHMGRRKRMHLGWIGQPGQFEDVAQVRRVLVRILREFPETQLVIVGDQHVYHLFESIPGNRRRYLPFPPLEEYPHLLDQIDILLVPYRNMPFNHSLPDKILVEASVKGIPWIASPMPAFVEWEAGGLIAYSPDEWHTRLRQLIMDSDLRQSLVTSGQQRAQVREIGHLKNAWLKAIKLAQKSTTLITLQETSISA